MTTLYRFFAFTALITCLIIGGCGYPAHIDPPLRTEATPLMLQLAAQAEAKAIGGIVLTIDASKHSMEPLLLNGDLVVVDPRITFEQVRLGTVIVAQERATGPSICHRATTRDAEGILTSGDHNAKSDTALRATKANYLGTVVSIYRLKP